MKNSNTLLFTHARARTHTHTHTKLRREHDEIFAKLRGCHYIKYGNSCVMQQRQSTYIPVELYLSVCGISY